MSLSLTGPGTLPEATDAAAAAISFLLRALNGRSGFDVVDGARSQQRGAIG